MQILPIDNFSINVMSCLGLLFDKAAPASGEYDVQKMFNEAVAIRGFSRSLPTTAPWRHLYMPTQHDGFNDSGFLPSLMVHGPEKGMTYVKSHAVPLIKLPALDQRSPAGAVQAYQEATASCIMAHKLPNTNGQYTTNGGMILSCSYNKTEEDYWLLAEYDFVSEYRVENLVIASVGSTAGAAMVTYNQNTFLQALVNGQWVDVVDAYANLRTTSNWGVVPYTLPAAVSATKFRLVNKAVANPFASSGYYPFCLHFYGDYVGAAPRTSVAKFNHMVLLNLQNAAYNKVNAFDFNTPASRATVLGRYLSQTLLTITDDVKQTATYDIYMQDASYVGSTSMPPALPSFRMKGRCLSGRAV